MKYKTKAGAALLIAGLWATTIAHAETITGTFNYQDSDGPRPIAEARVEIWRFAPVHPLLPIWRWANANTTATDSNGSINVNMNFVASGVVYAVRVFAANRAAAVLPNAVNPPAATPPFHQEPDQPDGSPRQLKVQSSSDVLDFSYTFRDSWSAQHYNVADTILLGFKYADARRDPAEQDVLTPVTVQPTSVTATGTWYNAPVDTIVLSTGDVFNDYMILHEYAHAIEAKISRLAWIVSTHSGCAAMIGTQLVNSPEHAWMEGFADYFVMAVARTVSAPRLMFASQSGNLGTSFVATLETPPACSVASPDAVENFVAATLWDLIDKPGDRSGVPGDFSSVAEPHDVIQDMDTVVFQIVDRELGALSAWPTINDFRNAWLRRNMAAGPLESVMRRHGMLPPALPIGYLDSIDKNGVARGWTLDPNSGATSTTVHFYVDGPYPAGTFAGSITASVSRADVNQQTGYPGNHGFVFNIPAQYKDGNSHSLYAYGIDVTSTRSALLTYAPLNFTVGLPMKYNIVSHNKTEYTETLTIFAYDATTGAPLNGDILIDGIREGVIGAPLTYTHSSLSECVEGRKPPCLIKRIFPEFTIQVPKYTPISFIR